MLETFQRHGLSAEIQDGALRVQDNLWLEPRVLQTSTSTPENVMVELSVLVNSPALEGLQLHDAFVGIGPTKREAESNGFVKFLLGSFHVLAEALTSHQCNEEQVDWLDWKGPNGQWQVCSGASLVIAGGVAPYTASQVYKPVFEELRHLFEQTAGPGPHWVRVFFASMQGKLAACEIVVDGAPWPEAEHLLTTKQLEYPERYESLRHLFIALPASEA